MSVARGAAAGLGMVPIAFSLGLTRSTFAKDLGVLNIASAFPFSIAPAIAPAILAIRGGSYGALDAVAGVCAIIGAVAVLRDKGVR